MKGWLKDVCGGRGSMTVKGVVRYLSQTGTPVYMPTECSHRENGSCPPKILAVSFLSHLFRQEEEVVQPVF